MAAKYCGNGRGCNRSMGLHDHTDFECYLLALYIQISIIYCNSRQARPTMSCICLVFLVLLILTLKNKPDYSNHCIERYYFGVGV